MTRYTYPTLIDPALENLIEDLIDMRLEFEKDLDEMEDEDGPATVVGYKRNGGTV